jgi:ssDNA-binding Zn-finger/Zn-ribbon topoisomerase 1
MAVENQPDKCEKCGGRLALVTGSWHYEPDDEPYEEGVEEEAKTSGGQEYLAASKCDDCDHIQDITIE